VRGGAHLEACGLAAGYAPGAPALFGVDFALGAGRAVGVLGPNGGGKTTLCGAPRASAVEALGGA